MTYREKPYGEETDGEGTNRKEAHGEETYGEVLVPLAA